MNIDIRDIKGDVLKCMNRLIEEFKFTSTAKATRFVIVDYFEIKRQNQQLQQEIKDLRSQLREQEKQIQKDNSFRKSLKQFLEI